MAVKKGLVKTDVQNAHIYFPKDGAPNKTIVAAYADPRLIP